MTNTESELKWTRIEPGRYTTDLYDQCAAYLVTRDDAHGGWVALTPVGAATGRREHLGHFNTLAEAKAMCERYAATPMPATATPTEWVDQLIALLDAGADIRFTKDADLIVSDAPVPTTVERVRQAAHAAIELGICHAVPQVDGTERVELTIRFRQERAESRGIERGAIVHYQLPGAPRPSPGRWEVAEIAEWYVRVWSPQGVWSAWPLEWAVLADQHTYVSDLSGRIDGPCLTAAYDCGRPQSHPIHLPATGQTWTRHTNSPCEVRPVI